jgi:hypothetical protein
LLDCLMTDDPNWARHRDRVAIRAPGRHFRGLIWGAP